MGRHGENHFAAPPRHPVPVPIFSLRLFVISVLAATATELAKLKPIGRGFLILRRYVVTTLAVITLKHNIVARHLLFPISDCQFA